MIHSRHLEGDFTITRYHDVALPMDNGRLEKMVDRLLQLQASSYDVEASAIVSTDGLSIATALPETIEEERVAAMSAAMLSLGQQISGELKRGILDQVYVKGKSGYVILTSVGPGAVLTVLARRQSKLGLLFLDMREVVEDLSQLL